MQSSDDPRPNGFAPGGFSPAAVAPALLTDPFTCALPTHGRSLLGVRLDMDVSESYLAVGAPTQWALPRLRCGV